MVISNLRFFVKHSEKSLVHPGFTPRTPNLVPRTGLILVILPNNKQQATSITSRSLSEGWQPATLTMPNSYFRFKQFTIYQDKCAFKVGTDGVLLGAFANVTGRKGILDIGTGTGLISLMLAQRSDSEITAIEPDYESFSQTSENFTMSKWSSRIRIENCTLQDFNPENSGFDLIVSNPPYFIDSLKNPDPAKSNARHNDSLAHSDILAGAHRLLFEDGLLQVIMPYDEGNIFIAEAQEHGFYCNSILKIRPVPSSEIRRMILGFTRKRTKPAERFLTIEKGKRHEFTEDYISLTKDFYLKF
jgi:tRNA1Val (adenine37-N6)-methyltransferase